MKRSAVIVLALLVLPVAAQAAVVDPHVARLAAVARVWGAVRFLDPWIYTHDVDWDAALVQALPKLRSAGNEDELAAAVAAMLKPLGDAATTVKENPPDAPPSPPATNATATVWSWPEPGVLAIDARGSSVQLRRQLDAIKQQLAKAKAVVFDLRGSGSYDNWMAGNLLTPLYAQLFDRPLPMAPSRSMQHSGYRPQSGASSGDYKTDLIVGTQVMLPPAPDAHARRAAFICNLGSEVPDAALAMQAAGQAVLLADDFDSDVLTAGTATLPLGEHHFVQYRVGDVVPVGIPPHVDAKLPPHADFATAVKAALVKLHQKPGKAHASEPLPIAKWQPDKSYADMKAPPVEYRLLALFRLWNIIDRFYPYKELLDHDWDDVLLEAIPKLEAAEGAVEYRRAIAQVAARIDDGHVWLQGGEDPLTVRPASPPFAVRVVEGQVVVAAMLAVPEAAPFHVGDVVVAVDGQPIAATMAALAPYRAGSNETWKRATLAQSATRGADGSTASFTLRGADGATREVKVARKLDWGASWGWRRGDIVKILDGNIGYVDLDRLEQADVAAAFDKLKGTRAIIFDMRGYPHGTAWTFAPLLNVKKPHGAARFTGMLVNSGREGRGSLRYAFTQGTAPPSPTPYRGATFMLVDERTMSQAEHTGLFFEALAGTRFIGSQTAGANGDVTTLVLPGNLRMSFTGHEVRHADGRQLQRVGLHPDVEAHATIKGLQSGHDEVLDRALQLVRNGK